MALDYSQILSGISELKKNNVKDDDIYDHLAGIDPAFKALKDNKVPFNEVVEHLKQTQGGETNNEVKNQPKANEDRNAGREADKQVDAERREANVQGSVQLRPQDQQVGGGNDNASKRERNGDTIQLSAIAPTEKGGELDGGKEKDAQAEDGYGPEVRQEGRQGLRSQGDAGNQAQVGGESGAVPPSPGLQHIADNNLPITAGVIGEFQKAVQDPAQAAIAVGSTLVEQGLPMLAATKAGAAVGGAASVPLTPLGGAAAGIATGAVVQPLTSALVKGSEDLLGIKDPIEKAQKEFPTLTKAANVAVMAPFAYQSLKNLGSQLFNTMDEQGALKAAMDVAKKVGVATGVGTPIMAGTEYATRAVEYWTKLSKEKPEVKLSELPEMALMSAIMQGYKEAKGKTPKSGEIEEKKVINIPAMEEGATERLDHAAFKVGKETFTGENHDEALKKALDAGKINNRFYKKYKGSENNALRNTEDFGYITNKGRFVGRKDAYTIAKDADQLITDKFLFEDENGVDLHSHEVALDQHPFSGTQDVKKFDGKSVAEVIKELSDDPTLHPSFRELAKVLAKAVNKTTKKDTFVLDPNFDTDPHREASRGTGWIWLPTQGTVRTKTLFHEMLHSFTSEKVDHFLKNYEGKGSDYLNNLNDALKRDDVPAELKTLIKLYKQTVSSLKLDEQVFGKDGISNDYDKWHGSKEEIPYGLINIHEFITEAFTDPDFQKLLKSSKYDGKVSKWDKFLEVLGKIFNIPTDSVAHQVMRSTLDLSRRQAGYRPTKGPKDYKEYTSLSESVQNNPTINALAARVPKSTDPREQTAWGRMIQKFDMFQDDLKAMGFKGVAQNIKDVGAEGFYRVKESTTMLMDTLQGRNVSKLRDAGVFEEATAHAQAKRVIDPWVNTIISEVFPDKYKVSELGKKEVADADWNLMVAERELNRIVKYGKKKGESDPIKLSEYGKAVADQQKIVDNLAKTSEEVKEKHDRIKPTIDIIVKDNILGGADAIQNQISDKTAELNDLQKKFDEGTAPKGTKGEIKALKENIDDLNEALDEIKKVHDLDQYGKDVEAAKGTDIEKDIERWEKIVVPIMNRLYQMANNTTSLPPTERGRVFGARINLLSKNDASKFLASEREDGPYKSVIATEYRNPDIKQDMLSKKAAFNADYSTDVEAILKNSFGTRYNQGTKLDFYKALLKNGVAVMPENGEKVEKIKGKPTAMMDIEDWPEFDPKTGKVTRSKKYMYMQRDLISQVKQVLDTTEHPEANPLFSGFNAIQLAAPTDAIVHSKNLVGTVTLALGRDSVMEDVINKIPILNSKNAMQEIYAVLKEIEADTPKIRREKYEIARMSGLRPHFDQGGIMRLLSKPQHDFLYYTDMAARIIMSRRYKNLIERGAEDSAEAKIDFINQIGEYNRRLMNRFEANMRDWGMSPFVVAGRAMNRFSRRVVLMSPGFKTKNAEAEVKARLIQASGLAMATLIPSMVNLITTGSIWGRPGTPIGAIDFGSNFDTSDDKHRVLDFYQLMNMRRGFRQLGFDAAFNGWRNGDSFSNIFNNITEDAKTVSMHPFVGPAIGFTYASLFGQRLDLRSGFQNVYLTRKIEGPAGLVERARVALKQQNQFVYDLGVGAAIEKGMEMYGIPKPVGGDESETLRDLGIPQHVPIFRQLYNVGVTAAGAAGGKLVVSPAMKLSAQLGTKEQYSPDQDIRFDYRKRINNLHRAGKEDEAKALYREGIDKKILTIADKKALSNQYKHPNVLFQRVERMKDPSDSISVFRVATPEEQDNIGPLIWKRISNSTSILKEQKDKLHNEMKSFAKEGSVLYKTIHSESK